MNEKIEIETCPGWLTWSAFGSSYPDTACSKSLEWGEGDEPASPTLCDADDDLRPKDIPCPFCSPESFTEYEFGGGYIVALCSEGEHLLADGTEIHYHDAESLWWSATCSEHGEQKVLMPDMSEQADFDEATFVPWEISAGWVAAQNQEDGND